MSARMVDKEPHLKNVLILERRGGRWASFLKDYFSDTPVTVSAIEEPSQAAVQVPFLHQEAYIHSLA